MLPWPQLAAQASKIDMSLQLQHDLTRWPKLLTVKTETIDINTDRGRNRAMYPDLSPSHNSGLEVTTAIGGSAGHPGMYGPGESMTLGHQYGLKCQPRPQASA